MPCGSGKTLHCEVSLTVVSSQVSVGRVCPDWAVAVDKSVVIVRRTTK